MAENKVTPKYIFEDPNTPKKMEDMLARILLEKLVPAKP